MGGQKTEDRGQRTEDRGQRTEDRGQRTEDRGQSFFSRSHVPRGNAARTLQRPVHNAEA